MAEIIVTLRPGGARFTMTVRCFGKIPTTAIRTPLTMAVLNSTHSTGQDYSAKKHTVTSAVAQHKPSPAPHDTADLPASTAGSAGRNTGSRSGRGVGHHR